MKQNSHAIRKVGLTGSMGSGKSTAANRFRELGAEVLDADQVSRHLLDDDETTIRQTISAFGSAILSENGRISRKKLAEIIFSDDTARGLLNSIIHPRVIARLHEKADEITTAFPDKIIILDVPLLFECHMEKDLDYTVVVTADANIRLRRIIKRDSCTEQEAKKRLSVQMPDEEKIKRADACIDNSTSINALYEQVDTLYYRLKEIPSDAK